MRAMKLNDGLSGGLLLFGLDPKQYTVSPLWLLHLGMKQQQHADGVIVSVFTM